MFELMEYFLLYRVVWIGGRLGFGKTALAFWLANQLVQRCVVDGLITNVPNIIPPHVQKDDGSMHNRCIIFDEAWTHLDVRTSRSNSVAYGAYARKIGAYWIFPSVHPIDKRLRAITIKPMFRNVFTNATCWRYVISDDERNPTMGTFWFQPKEAYGLYSTGYIPSNDCGIHTRFEVSYYEETGVHFGDKENEQKRHIAQLLAEIQDDE